MNRQVNFIFVAIAAFAILATAEDSPLFTSDNKVDCVNKMVDWCDNIKYPKEGAGMSMISVAVTDDSGKFHRVFCSSDSDGTNCTKNGSPWFSCNPEHQLTYEGTELKKDSTDGVDDRICNTTKMAFNDIFIQNLSFNPVNATTEITKGMESFFELLANLQEQMDMIRNHILRPCYPFCLDNGRNPYEGQDPATEYSESSVTAQSNQLERE